MLTLNELFEAQKKQWNEKNIRMFGVRALDTKNMTFREMQEEMRKCTEEFWNKEEKSLLEENILNGNLAKDMENFIPGSFRLDINVDSMAIDVKVSRRSKNGEEEIRKLVAIPLVDENLSWIINNTYYTPRITSSTPKYKIIKYKNNPNIVLGEGWEFNIEKDEFTIKASMLKSEQDAIDKLTKRSKLLLETVLKEELSINNFRKALIDLPAIDNNSIFKYEFLHLDYYENLLFKTNNYASLEKGVILGLNNKIRQTSTGRDEVGGQLVITTRLIVLSREL